MPKPRLIAALNCACLLACSAHTGAPAPKPAPPPPPQSTGSPPATTSPSPSFTAEREAGSPAEAPSPGRSGPAEAHKKAGGPHGGSAPAPAMARPANSKADTDQAEDQARDDKAAERAEAKPEGFVAHRAAALKAGRHDDSKSYAAYLAFLRAHAGAIALPLDVSERLTLRAVDVHGRSLANCKLAVLDAQGKQLAALTTYADGQSQFFPAAQSAVTDKSYAVEAQCLGETHRTQFERAGARATEARFLGSRQVPPRVPLDVAIVLDTTGSMQSQIDRLRDTLAAIHFQIAQLPSHPDVRFALVAYRDRGDDYITQVTPFTGDVKSFEKVLAGLSADGGGDTPEDMQSAMEQGLHALSWRADAVRLGFVVADAPPHTDYQQAFDYRAAMQESLQRGIKWTGVGVGGLPVAGEIVLRQLAQFTLGEYVFVTSGDGGDSDGSAGEASHHTGSNYRAENLDQAIVRIVRRELSYLGEAPRDWDDTLHASAQDGVGVAMAEVVRQLVDYSSMPLAVRTPVAVLPVVAADKPARPLAGQLSEALLLAASRHPGFRSVDRDLKAVAQEMKLQLGDLADDTQAVPIGKLVGAQLLVTSRVAANGELYARLVRVETGEILSVARVVALPTP